jgi:hypothetical protein
MTAQSDGIQLQKIEYYRQVRHPTLKQFLHRKNVAEVMAAAKSVGGVVFDQESQRAMPRSAQHVKGKLKGMTADKVAEIHPEWVEEWEKLYGGR